MSIITFLKMQDTRRGDTLVEVMFAFAIFSLVSILTIAMMNMGIANAEQSLELTVTRGDVNAEAEAIRFIHSSYVSEHSLAENCSDGEPRCQQYKDLWEEIKNNAINALAYDGSPVKDSFTFCRDSYNNPTEYQDKLRAVKAFVINFRNIKARVKEAYISADSSSESLFRPPDLNARILFGTDLSESELRPPTAYDTVKQIDGIWVVAVEVEDPNHVGRISSYDFYISSCWYGSNAKAPTTIDTVIRLYNPAEVLRP